MTAWWLAAAWLALCAAPLIWTDFRTHRLPNKLTLAAYAGTTAPLVTAAATEDRWHLLGASLLGGVVLAVGYVALAVALPRGLGLGDAKLAASLGTLLGWLGWPAILTATFASFLTASLYGISLVITHRATPGHRIPFAPFMIAGAIVAALLRMP